MDKQLLPINPWDVFTHLCHTFAGLAIEPLRFGHAGWKLYTVNPKKYAHGFVVLCFVVFMQSFIMNSHEVFIHIHQGCFAGTGAIVWLPQCQWSKPDGYGNISPCITTTKHSKAKTVCIFLGIYCMEQHIHISNVYKLYSYMRPQIFTPALELTIILFVPLVILGINNPM